MLKITDIHARKILNSRGEWTIEVRVELENEYRGTISMPHGVSAGSFEAHSVDAEQAVTKINNDIRGVLKGFDGEMYEELDAVLIDLDGTSQKSNLGSNSILGVSLACAKAVSRARKIAFWKYLRELYGIAVPDGHNMRLMMNFIEGGVHAGSDLGFQEYLVIPKGKNIEDSITKGTRLYNSLKKYLLEHVGRNSINVGDEGGFALQTSDNKEPFSVINKVADNEGMLAEIEMGVDVAANNVNMDVRELTSIYKEITDEFSVTYIEDPFSEDDFTNFSALTKKVGERVMIAGDDLTTTNPVRMDVAHRVMSINAIIIKPDQIGSLSEALRAVHMARGWNWQVIASHRGGETNDDFIVDFAYAIGADGIKIGGPARGERIAKYNRLLEISK
ncbi:MAG: hypothetical protein A3B96_04205 [Candidatus Spechtbacteria bacterium RIFCSPHIGHO2_02_FULL_43_15b]|nr:MAG: hypothetical protein A3B96_04205 [Candidatus Spechtbacteria bacterium RIFCSPHIGHO2_02_FULL_43_15b]